METARPATEADLDRLVELCRAALAEVGSDRRGGALFAAREGRAEPVEESLAGILRNEDALLVAGTIDDVVVGYAAAQLELLRDGARLGRIDDLYVEPGARSVGVGEAMMKLLLDWCREHRCRGVDALALPGMRATKNFFEESGFSARLIVMHHRMADAS